MRQLAAAGRFPRELPAVLLVHDPRGNAAIVEADTARDRHLAESEPEMIRLAVRIARKIIGEELRLNPQAIVSMAAECLQGLRRERSLTTT